MKTRRLLLFTLVATLSVFFLIAYSACKRDKCRNITCLNGGSCYNGVCTCPAGITGSRCETDLCSGITCYNGGMCVSGKCNCPAGFEGDNCEVVNKFLGTYSAYDSCTGSTTKLYVTGITMKGTGEPVLKIVNFGNYQTTAFASISSTGNNFSINGTTYEGYYIQGSGVYDNGKINIGYTVTYSTTTTSCNGVWTKQ